MNVLVAHPEPWFRRLAREVLAPHRLAVHEAADGDAAVAACRRIEPDVTLLAARLAPAGPRGVLAAIKSATTGHGTAVILVTDALAPADVVAELGRGAHDLLFEPVDPGELVARVRAAQRTKQLQDEVLARRRRLEDLIYRDALTGIYNRRFVLAQLHALVSAARRHTRPFTAIMLDLDHFKALNDAHGHAVGDAALVAVTAALRSRLRREDHLGRLGGEEFLALVPDTGEESAAAVAEALRRTVADVVLEPPGGRSGAVSVTVSVGWAAWAGDSPEALVRRADEALYAAKAAGRNVVRASLTGRS